MTEVTPQWKTGPRRKKARPLRAEPERPMALSCEALIRGVCSGGPTTDRHHVRGRAHPETVDLCHACHMWLHAHPEQAYALGLLKKRNSIETPEEKEPWPEIRSTSENY